MTMAYTCQFGDSIKHTDVGMKLICQLHSAVVSTGRREGCTLVTIVLAMLTRAAAETPQCQRFPQLLFGIMKKPTHRHLLPHKMLTYLHNAPIRT